MNLLEESSKPVVFFDTFHEVKKELSDLLSFKTMICNPFELEEYSTEHVVIEGKYRSDKSLTKVASMELPRLMVYCGLRQEGYSPLRRVVFFYLHKKDGRNTEILTCYNNDSVTAQSAGLLYKKQRPMVSYVIGTSTGYLKTFSVGDVIETSRMKLHSVAIVGIEFAHKNSNFNHRSLVLALTEDQAVFVTNLEKSQVIGQYKGGIIPLRSPLGVSFHGSHRYFLEGFDDGCVQIWQMTTDLFQKIEGLHKLPKVSKVFKKYYGILPAYQLHNAALDGLRAVQFFGNFLLLLTHQMRLRMISLDNSVEQSYLQIFEQSVRGNPGSTNVLMQVIKELELILILADNKIFYLQYNDFGVLYTRVLSLHGLSTVNYFHLSAKGVLFASGFNDQIPSVFVEKLTLRDPQKPKHDSVVARTRNLLFQ